MEYKITDLTPKKKNMEYKITDFTPINDSLIVKPVKVEEMSGFIRPQTDEDKSEMGEVVSVSAAIPNCPVKVGDIILFNKYSSTNTDLGDELILRIEDVVAVAQKKQ